VLGLFCLKGRAILHADDTCFELQKEDSAYVSVTEELEIETEHTDLDLICFSMSVKDEARVIYAPHEIVRNAPHLADETGPAGNSYLCWDASVKAPYGFLMGFFRGTGHQRIPCPSKMNDETRERVSFIYEIQGHGLSLVRDEEEASPTAEETLLEKEDALLLPPGAAFPLFETDGAYALVWASCEVV